MQVPVGGGDDAHIDVHRLAAAHAGDLFLLEDPQELGLGGQGELAHLIQKDGALVGHFKQAGLALPVGTGESAALIAKELTLSQVFRDGPAVDADEVFGGAGGALVDIGGDALLAGARLALDEDDGVQLGGAADDAQQVQGGRVLGHQLGGGHELRPDDGHLLPVLGRQAALVVQGLLQGGQLGNVPHVGHDQADVIVLVVDGGAGDHGLLAGGEGLLQGHGLALVQGLEGGGVGNDAGGHQLGHGDAQHVCGGQAGDDLIGVVAPQGGRLAVGDEDAVKRTLQHGHEPGQRRGLIRRKGQAIGFGQIHAISFHGVHLFVRITDKTGGCQRRSGLTGRRGSGKLEHNYLC